MKLLFLTAYALLTVLFANGQNPPDEYFELIKQADSLYTAKTYPQSTKKFSLAFESYGWKGLPNDRYKAACSWALAGVPDSAFYNLNLIAAVADYSNFDHITNDQDLASLHEDPRWKPLLEVVAENKSKAEPNLNKQLMLALYDIHEEDQKYRREVMEISNKYGWDSPETKAKLKIMGEKDSVNLIKIKAILDEYGWLGPEVVGFNGNRTLFLVIQHADLATQENYLPMMREAVKKGKAVPAQLALLEDRVALGQGKKQIYGSQIGRDPETELYYVSPLEDPDNVDKRRAEVGLGPLTDYVAQWDIIWDVGQYKKDLPRLEEIEKKLPKN